MHTAGMLTLQGTTQHHSDIPVQRTFRPFDAILWLGWSNRGVTRTVALAWSFSL